MSSPGRCTCSAWRTAGSSPELTLWRSCDGMGAPKLRSEPSANHTPCLTCHVSDPSVYASVHPSSLKTADVLRQGRACAKGGGGGAGLVSAGLKWRAHPKNSPPRRFGRLCEELQNVPVMEEACRRSRKRRI